MKAKEYLGQIGRLDTVLKQKKKELAELRLMADGISSIDYSKERVQGTSSKKAPFEDPLEQIDKLEREIITETVSFANEKHKMINQIQQMPAEKYIRILYDKYIDQKSLVEIAAEKNYSYEYICSLHGEALKEFEKENPMKS